MKDFFADRRPHDGFSYADYRARWKDAQNASPEGLDPDERKMLHYLKYNWERQADVHDAYTPSDTLRRTVEAIDEPQLWMVITEPWCGDSAFLLPVIAEAAALNDDITLRILHRDENLDIMDQYLTGGSRSIPKLVAFSDDGTERFIWGPRPADAAATYQRLKAEHDDKMEIIRRLIDYYEDGGWQEADDELARVIRSEMSAQASHA